ncbi:MAG: hemolysin family protein [Solobacterium sp.]|nr:hemolysin family protein [Solobacterium sp.]
MMQWLLFAGIAVCLLLSHFFSGAEMAYSSCNKMRLENEKDAGSDRAGAALRIAEHFDDALGAILIGNNLVNIAASSMASVLVILLTHDDSKTWIATAVLTAAVIIYGETIPKITAKKGANKYAVKYAYPVTVLIILLRPAVALVVFLVNLITLPLKGGADDDSEEKVEELQSIIETAEVEDVIDEEEKELVQNAISFSDLSASDAMTARVDVLAIDIEDSTEEILDVIEKSHFTRIPVYEGSVDHIIGILHLNRFLKSLIDDQKTDIRELLMDPCYVYKTMKLPEVLKVFRKAKQHLAVVVDEYGGTLGIISMEDVLEQVVGDIWDESDTVEEEVVKRTEREYEVDGDMPIVDFLDLVNIREDKFECESETVGGWTIETFGTFPQAGNSFHVFNFKVTVLAMDDRRVEKVLVTLDEETES